MQITLDRIRKRFLVCPPDHILAPINKTTTAADNTKENRQKNDRIDLALSLFAPLHLL
jgi:hypothetical protein